MCKILPITGLTAPNKAFQPNSKEGTPKSSIRDTKAHRRFVMCKPKTTGRSCTTGGYGAGIQFEANFANAEHLHVRQLIH
jgi:hypothetical protein